jgi:site-specific DNA recombinase
MQNCFIYCRVSTEEQAEQGYSLDAQEKLCRSFAEHNGYRVVGVFRDEGKSGTSLDRPALQELISNCTDGNSVSAVIVQETDRLARNTKDHLTIKAILKKTKVKLISVAQPMLDDSPFLRNSICRRRSSRSLSSSRSLRSASLSRCSRSAQSGDTELFTDDTENRQ